MRKIKWIGVSALVGVVSCSSPNIPGAVDRTQGVAAGYVTSIENPHSEEVTSQGVGACTKGVSYPHQSEYNSAEVIAKGMISCTRDSDPIVGYVTVYLKDAFGSIIDQKTIRFQTSPTSPINIPYGTPGLVAAAPCTPGTYIGSVRTKYYNLTGTVISIGLPTDTPPQRVTCTNY